MIDLHCHVLPGVDDGPGTLEESVRLGRVAAAEGTRVLAATCHVSHRYPTTAAEMTHGVERVNAALREEGIPVEIVTGAEIAPEILPRLEPGELERLTLGGGPYLLLEAPLSAVGTELEGAVRGLQEDGFGIVLAHPERCPSFHREPGRLRDLVATGVLCSLTASSFTGRFGRPVQALSRRLLADGLVHNVASDAHDAEVRPPALRSTLEAAGTRLAGLDGMIPWLTEAAPEAILAGRPLPPAPPAPRAGRRRRLLGWRR
jgi:protein-tyrosine phosphatase